GEPRGSAGLRLQRPLRPAADLHHAAQPRLHRPSRAGGAAELGGPRVHQVPRAVARAALALLACVLCGCPTRAVQRPPAPRPEVALPPPHAEPELVGKTHVVKPGETLWRISRMYEVEVAELKLANGIDDVTQLEVGRTLLIPGAVEPEQ